ncbi:MAG TPA: hypothetical protein GX528_09435 [Firmicutes bacterium]|nr:hypothetical protein [Bacillota bacterium]
MASLRHKVRRRFGSAVRVRLIDADLNRGWRWERPLPLVLLAGKVILRGEISAKVVLKKIESLLAEGEL